MTFPQHENLARVGDPEPDNRDVAIAFHTANVWDDLRGTRRWNLREKGVIRQYSPALVLAQGASFDDDVMARLLTNAAHAVKRDDLYAWYCQAIVTDIIAAVEKIVADEALGRELESDDDGFDRAMALEDSRS